MNKQATLMHGSAIEVEYLLCGENIEPDDYLPALINAVRRIKHLEAAVLRLSRQMNTLCPDVSRDI